MKKVLFVFLLAGLTVFCFARGNLELYGGMPFNFESTSAGDSSMRSFSAGVAFASPLNDFIGFGFYESILFPQELKATAGGVTVTTGPGDYKLILGNDMLLGPVFTIYRNGKIRIPAAAGLHLFTLLANGQSASSIGYEFGAGGNIGCEFYFSEKWYVVGRAAVNWDFYAMTRLDTAYGGSKTDSGTITGFGIAPQIGVGYRF
jgi:hypothetical protein